MASRARRPSKIPWRVVIITNYCYPRNWPPSKMRSRVREDPRIRFTYGIHPRIVTLERTSTLNNWMEDLDHRLNTTKVVAVGECGLYSTDMKTDINKQLEYFEKQIVLALKKSVPVVIHCRGDTRLDEQCLTAWLVSYREISKYTDTASMENRIHIINGKLPFLTAKE